MDKEEILQNLFDKGYVEKEIDIIPGKRTAVIRNVNVKTQMKIEKEMDDISGNAAFTIHSYSLKLVSHVLKRYGSQHFENPEEAQKYLDNLPSVVIDKIVNEVQELENQISEALEIENVNSVFSKGVEQTKDLEQSSEVSTPEKKVPSESQ